MTKWLERAKREIPKLPGGVTAITDDRGSMSATAASQGAPETSSVSIGSNGSTPDDASTIFQMPARNPAGREAVPRPRRWLPPDIEEVPADELPPEW